MREKELIDRKINKDRSLFTLKYWDRFKLKNYINQVKQRISMIASEIDTSIVIEDNDEDALPNFNKIKIKIKNSPRENYIKKNLYNTSSSPGTRLMSFSKSRIDIFKNKMNFKSNKAQINHNTPLHDIKFKTLIDFKQTANKKERSSINSAETSFFNESNQVHLRTSIFKIRKQFDESLQSLKNPTKIEIKKVKNKKSTTETDNRLSNNINTRSSIIDKYTSSIPLRMKKLKKKNLNLNSEYTDEEMKQIINDVKSKGCLLVKDSKNKIKFYSFDNNNILQKDHYMNKISEDAAIKYKNIIKQNYLQNSKKRYSQENLFSKIDKRSIDNINVNRIKINAINYDYITSLKRIADK